MTRYGRMTEANEIAAGIVVKFGTVVPVWCRYDRELGRFNLDWRLFEEIRIAGAEPVVYAEPPKIYVDEDLRLLAARSRGALIRWMHEPNGGGLFWWQGLSAAAYISEFRFVANIFHEEGARIAYCVTARGKANDDMMERYPGDDAVDVVGFDEFHRAGDRTLPPQRWAHAISTLGATGKPVWAFETGAEREATRRVAFVESLAQVQGVEAICAFDRRIVVPSHGIDDDFRFSPAMRIAWEAL